MRRSIIGIALGMLLPAVAHSATVTVKVGEASNSYTLQSLSVDAGGNVTVTATAGGTVTPPDTTVPPTPNPTPTPTPPAPTEPTNPPAPTEPTPPTASGCTPSSTLTCVNTALPATTFQRVAYRPDPKMVYAFRIQTPARGGYLSAVSATVQTASRAAKLLVVSEVAGDVSTAGKASACFDQGNEVSALSLAINRSDVHPRAYCHLKPNTTYYINVASTTEQGRPTCSTASNCGFWFQGR